MRIARITVEFDLTQGEGSVEQLRDFLTAYLARGGKAALLEPGAVQGDYVGPEQLTRLRRLTEGLTPKQAQVWSIFMANPGPIAASRLKELLPELRQPGALPGVFRAAHRWVTQLGGPKGDCPFVQIRWTGSEGIYRGLTPAEADALAGG
jgi:hypothetical protein